MKRLSFCAVPINLHIGNMGVASAYPQTVDSVPPAIHGGNIDDRRIGKGATMYYPVQVTPLNLRTMWDTHSGLCLQDIFDTASSHSEVFHNLTLLERS